MHRIFQECCILRLFFLAYTYRSSSLLNPFKVTGAAGGLGKCIAIELAARGCHVAICDINFDLAVTTAKEIANKYGVKAKAYKVSELEVRFKTLNLKSDFIQ